MRNIILTILLFLAVFISKGQEVKDNGFVPACHAAYTATPDPQDSLILHFQDQSTGQITLWQWSFGDGSTSTLQNPVHTYLQGGTFFVCLTVSNTNTGVICHDILCLAITIHEPGKCIADYHFQPDQVNPLLIHFTDESSGNVNRWHWSFGDGTSSDERSPDHTFPADGKFPVCLTAYQADSISICLDVKCDSILVNPLPQCDASYSFSLDSLNPEPLTYVFASTSLGNPTQFQWDMGDGTVYNTPACTHTFAAQGSYKVCLSIRRMAGGFLVCADSVCNPLSTEKYFDMGGHLFIGEYPINNPVSTGDTGVVYLFRKTGPGLVQIEKNTFTYLGYYTFPKVLNGAYVIKAALTPGSLHFKEFIPAYFPSEIKWMDAGNLHLYDSNDYNMHVRLVQSETMVSGPGKIAGKVEHGEPGTTNAGLQDVEVVLYDAEIKPLTFGLTDNLGDFLFENIPFGSYYLYVEYPGLFSRLTPVWLDGSVPVADSIILGVFDHNVAGIPIGSVATFQVGPLYPNPAQEHFKIDINSAKHLSVRLEIVDSFGNLLLMKDEECEAGQSVIGIPLFSYRPGVYIISIRANESGETIKRKLLVY